MAKKMIDKENLKELKEKSTGFIDEFKAFIMRGNVMDMAIGVIIGGAFSNIVTALTTDLINPLINGIGGAEIGGSFEIYGGQRILYGDFITSVINFIIMAFVLFVLLKTVNKIMMLGKKKEEAKEEDSVKTTPAKSEEVLLLEEIRDLLKKQNSKSK